MSLILNIDTSTETASVSIARDGELLACITNGIQKEHASFLHPAIQDLQRQTKMALQDLSAIAVTCGPGSYTGLRVGMASAKGLSYALGKPFITVNTLEAMALAAITSEKQEDILYVPLIDARRMEVYTAAYDNSLAEVIHPMAMVLDNKSFSSLLENRKILFFGSGMPKWKPVVSHANALFKNIAQIPEAIGKISYKKFTDKTFTNVVMSEPLYIKEFYDGK